MSNLFNDLHYTFRTINTTDQAPLLQICFVVANGVFFIVVKGSYRVSNIL